MELKQGEPAELTPMDRIVRTFIGGGVREVSHPSCQAWSYASLLQDFNDAVYEGDIELHPCAYPHNFREPGVLDGEAYRDHVGRAPVFLKEDLRRLRDFIKRYVKSGSRCASLQKRSPLASHAAHDWTDRHD